MPSREALKKRARYLSTTGLVGLVLALYVSRMAPSVVPGDPGEYQLIAARWGIGHPPGYGFYALVGNIFTRLVPFGTSAWRANLLSALAGALIVALVYDIGLNLGRGKQSVLSPLAQHVGPIIGALALATGMDLWQHAIHANAHILTALLATTALFALVRWWRLERERGAERNGWLYFFSVVAGLSPVQHPLLVFAFPACALSIVAVRPRILKEWKTLLTMVGFALLGAAAYLYYPLRSTLGPPPPPGPTDMHTWTGFLRVVTAQGLRVNLLQFSLGEILQRLWDVRMPLGLQYGAVSLLLAGVGWVGLWRWRPKPALLLTGYIGCIVLVTVNILQDEMAYLLGPLIAVGVLIGQGASLVVGWLSRRLGRGFGWVGVGALAVVAAVWPAVTNWSRMDLSAFRDADEWLGKVETQLGGQGATLLTEWERMTTVYYYAGVEGQMQEQEGAWVWQEPGIRFVPISAGTPNPFGSAVDAYLPTGPVYMTMYRPQVAERYRLMPSGDFWRALPNWPRELPAEANQVEIAAEDKFEIVGWQLREPVAQAGEVLSLDLYMRLPHPEGVETQRYYLPWAMLGTTRYYFTTDSRFHTPWWQPDEIVVERFDLPIKWSASPGVLPLRVGVQVEDREMQLDNGEVLAPLTQVEVKPATWRPPQGKLDQALGNLGGGMLLRGARINRRRARPGQRIELRPGHTLRVVLEWESLRPIDENYTVFVQLLDTSLRLWAQSDTTPLGGALPTLLWFPRWRQGTRVVDTHLLHLPADLLPGDYPIVVGMYGFSTHKRVQVVSADGDVEGDWITIAHGVVE